MLLQEAKQFPRMSDHGRGVQSDGSCIVCHSGREPCRPHAVQMELEERAVATRHKGPHQHSVAPEQMSMRQLIDLFSGHKARPELTQQCEPFVGERLPFFGDLGGDRVRMDARERQRFMDKAEIAPEEDRQAGGYIRVQKVFGVEGTLFSDKVSSKKAGRRSENELLLTQESPSHEASVEGFLCCRQPTAFQIAAAMAEASDDSDCRISIGDAQHLLETVRVERIIGVQNLYVAALWRRCGDRTVPILNYWNCFNIGENTNAPILRSESVQDFSRFVGACVVERHNLEVLVALRERALDAFAQKGGAIVDRHDDADEWGRVHAEKASVHPFQFRQDGQWQASAVPASAPAVANLGSG